MLRWRKARAAQRPRPKLTVAVPFPVHPPLSGGRQRVFALYRYVARHFDIDLVTLAESDDEAFDREIAPGLREIRVPKSARHQSEEIRLAQVVGSVPVGDIGIPLFVEHTPEYAHQLERSLEGAAAVVACHPYALPAIRSVARDRPLVYEAQDVEYLLKKQFLESLGPTGGELVQAVRELEAETCRASRLVICCSESDRAELGHLYGVDAARTVVAPNGVDVDAVRFTPPSLRERRKAEVGLAHHRLALFVGSWHPPNLDAAEVVFGLAQALPAVNFLLVGSQCLPLVSRARPANVGLMGVVDDETLGLLLSVADVALNPMLGGSGTNLKVPLYLAAGIPVLTTPVGARGYELTNGDSALISRAEDFPEGIATLLGDAALAERLAHRGRRLVERRYDWKSIASGVVAALGQLASPAYPPMDPLDDLVASVSAELAMLGTPDDHPLMRQVAVAMAETGVVTESPGQSRRPGR